MSRITSNEVQRLMEAYNAVYTPQELTEEQVWEEVETWVNSLLEEGYDLSEYTWEEMYEEYLSEAGNPGGAMAQRGSTTSGAVTMYGPNDPRRNQSRPTSRFARPAPATAIRTRSGTQSAPVSNLGRNYRGQELQATARANASQVKPTAPVARPAAAPAAAPAPAARPATPAPAAARPATPRPKPTPTTPKPDVKKGPTGMPLVGGIERRIPTSAELKAAQEKRAAQKSVASSFTSAPISGAPKYAPPAFNLKQSYDLYDVIKGHLLDEGYADTEEAAEAIMVSMSEDWRESILEQVTGTGSGRPMEGETPGHVGPKTPPPVKRMEPTNPPPVK